MTKTRVPRHQNYYRDSVLEQRNRDLSVRHWQAELGNVLFQLKEEELIEAIQKDQVSYVRLKAVIDAINHGL
jgi:hypothetical protein